ncbi:MAG: hypothetical protein ACRDKI_01335 [Solirubrobacterales bacterium]
MNQNLTLKLALTGAAALTLLAITAGGAVAAPSQISLSASPKTVVNGKIVTLTGHLKGSNNAAKNVQLQVSAFPFTSYVPSAVTLTNVSGDYSFTAAPAVATRYKVLATDFTPAEESSVQTVTVNTKVSIKASDSTPKRGAKVRFSGYAWPAHDGTVVELQRRTTTGAFVTVAKTVLKDAGTTRSVYSRALRVRKNGVYLVKVAATPENLAGTSATKSIRVHR